MYIFVIVSDCSIFRINPVEVTFSQETTNMSHISHHEPIINIFRVKDSFHVTPVLNKSFDPPMASRLAMIWFYELL